MTSHLLMRTFRKKFKKFSNQLSDEEIISTKIDSHHFNTESDLIESFLNRDTLIISSPKFDSLLEDFSSELAHIELIPPGINEVDFDPEEDIHLVKRLLYDNSSPRPPKEFNSKNSDAIIESFSPSPIPVEDSDSLMKEIDLFLTLDDSMPPGIENDDYHSERDILFLEEFLSNDSPSLPENKSFHFDVPSSLRPPAKPPDDGIYFEPDTRLLTAKVVAFCLGLRFPLEDCVLSLEDLVFCLQNILHFVFINLAFCLHKILHFVFKDIAFCLGSIAFYLSQESCILSLKHCVLSLQHCVLHNFQDLAFCLRNAAFSLYRSCVLPNGEALRKCIMSGPYKPTTVLVQVVDATDDSQAIPEHTTVETPINMSPENKAHFEEEKEAIHLILTRIRDEIYSTFDTCQTAQEMWEAIKRNKNVDTTPRYKNDDHSGQFGNQRTANVAGARENVGSLVVQQYGIRCFNYKEFGHFTKECRKPKRVKDSAYHKEKMLMCKQAEQGVPLQAE
nr:hypothetical protein [Tanacetum cinerariifolium]